MMGTGTSAKGDGVMRSILLLAIAFCLLFPPAVNAQEPGTYEIFISDPVEVCPKRYKVEHENDALRALRLKLEPNDEGILCKMRPYLIVLLTDADIRIEADDWATITIIQPAGGTRWVKGGWQRIENRSTKKLECLIVEPRSTPLSRLLQTIVNEPEMESDTRH